MLMPIMRSVVLCQKTEPIWFCKKCKKPNLEINTTKIIEEIDQPSYRKVVPAPPVQRIGLHNRFVFESEFKAWFYNFLEELQHQLALYRIEYVAQHGHDMGDSAYVDEGDKT